ncbi:stress protein [Ammoniphilus oxalaticus]|uniref:Stress protein n=1 Tax=Ammoniphilus oxalaticus TaxID=66863 RepID=A0A419SM51_9BACL|nr:Dabb family protein [Ammoniphilus oxalaticus]RKD25062.1 stress protein [Ammoniphilus oxalaticus]
MINRVVLLKFSDKTTEEQYQEVITRFKALESQLPGIAEIHAGRNVSKRNQEYQLILNVRFSDQNALETYEASAEHGAVAAYIKEVGRLDSIGVDFVI